MKHQAAVAFTVQLQRHTTEAKLLQTGLFGAQAAPKIQADPQFLGQQRRAIRDRDPGTTRDQFRRPTRPPQLQAIEGNIATRGRGQIGFDARGQTLPLRQ